MKLLPWMAAPIFVVFLALATCTSAIPVHPPVETKTTPLLKLSEWPSRGPFNYIARGVRKTQHTSAGQIDGHLARMKLAEPQADLHTVSTPTTPTTDLHHGLSDDLVQTPASSSDGGHHIGLDKYQDELRRAKLEYTTFLHPDLSHMRSLTKEDDLREKHEEFPSHLDIHRCINLIKHNPDNHKIYMNRLNRSRIRKKDPAQYARRYEDLVQSARAFGWMTDGKFVQSGWSMKEQFTKSPAVHAVYTSTPTESIVMYPSKESDWRKLHMRRIQRDRNLKRGEALRPEPKPYLSRHSDLHDLDSDLQLKHDELEREQQEALHKAFYAGELPQLHRDEKTGVFRLIKSPSNQYNNRLASQAEIEAYPEEVQDRIHELNRKKKRKGIFKIMHYSTDSSDDEYQLPRRQRRPPSHHDPTKSAPAPPRRRQPYDLSQRKWAKKEKVDVRES